jgi:structure-specific recognition protein 1
MFDSHHGQVGIKCSIKASEGFLYCLEKAFMFVPKPATYIAYEQIKTIVFSRVGGAVSASRTFDITVQLKEGGESQFSNINREEQTPLQSFFNVKGLKVRNDMEEDNTAMLKAALRDDLSSDDEVVAPRADRGSAEEDSESDDEDFQEDSDSDVAEEFDSAHESSGSDDEDGPASDAEEKRPKKKVKTG